MSSRRTTREEEEKRKREQEQGARRRQTNQGTRGGTTSAIAAVKEKVAQAQATANKNRKSTDTRANSGKSAPQSQTAKSAGTQSADTKNRKSTDTRANSGKSAVQHIRDQVKQKETQIGQKLDLESKRVQRQYELLRLTRRNQAMKANEIALDNTYGVKTPWPAFMSRPAQRGLTPDEQAEIARLEQNIEALRVPMQNGGTVRNSQGVMWGVGGPTTWEQVGPGAVKWHNEQVANLQSQIDAIKARVNEAPASRRDDSLRGKTPMDFLEAAGWTKLRTGMTPDQVRGELRDTRTEEAKNRERAHAVTNQINVWNRNRARQQSAANQTLSRHDNKLRKQVQQEIKLAKADFDSARARGDAAGMQAAHQRAETWRRIEGGYSGGATGLEHIVPKLDQGDISTLNKTGQRQLRSAKLGYENAQTDQERSRYAAMGQDIRRNPGYQKETYDRGAYRETDVNGRMRYAGTAEERAKEAEQGAAIPKAIGTGIAGSFLSLPGTTARALQADAARNQAALQRLSDIRGGGQVNISEPARVSPDSLGQRLLNRSNAYREKATEGQTGLNRYLTEALITGGEMVPGLAATALTGGAAAPGLAVMGAQAAGRRMGELERQGEDPVRAFTRGLATGLIEAATERVPLGNLTKIAKGGGKSFARNMLTQALEEVGTEELSEIGNYAADRAFGDKNASLTAKDLRDTAVISLLTSLGMGAGAGIVGSRRTGRTAAQTGAETRGRTEAGSGPVRQDETPSADDSIRAKEAQLQAREKDLDTREQRALERMGRSTDSETNFNYFRNELVKVRQERGQLQQERIRLAETRRQAEVSRAEEQARQAEAERFAAESRYRPEAAREAGADLAEDQVRRVDRQAQAARDRLNGEVRPTITALRDTLRGAAEQRAQTGQDRQTAPGLTPLEVPERTRARQAEPVQEAERKRSAGYGTEENHIDNRGSYDMGDRRVKAFQWDHPEVKPYFRQAAEVLKRDAEYADASRTMVRASKAQRNRNRGSGRVIHGTVMEKSDAVKDLMRQGMSTTDIIKACDAILNDQGQENYAAAKRVELALDTMLSNGYLPAEAGRDEEARVGPNEGYLRVKESLPGAVRRGSFEDYLRHNALSLGAGEVTEDELRQEWEADRQRRQEREALYRSAEDWGQTPRRYRSMEEELAAHAQRVSDWMDEPEMQDAPEEYWRQYWQQARAEEQSIREKWAGREAETPRVRENVDAETGEVVQEERRPAAASVPAVTENPALTEAVREERGPETADLTPNLTEREAGRQEREAAFTAEPEYREAYDRTAEDRSRQTREETAREEDRRTEEEEPYSVGAAPGGFDPYSRMANEYGTIEPGENPARMVDVPLSTNGEDRVSKAARTFMEAGLTSEATQRNIERDIVRGMFSHNVKGIEETVDRAYDYLDHNGLEAAEARWDNVVRGRIKTTEDELALGMALWANAERTGNADRASALAAQIAAEGTTAGRMVNIYRMLKRATPEGRVYYARKMYDKIQEDLNKKYGKKAPKLEANEELLEDYRTAETEKERFDTLDRIYEDVARQMPRRIGDIVNAWRYFAMLGNPRTHIRNVVGNVLFGELERASGKVSAAMQKAILPQEQRTRSLTATREARDFAARDADEMEQMLRGDKYDSDFQGIQRKMQERALGPFSFLSKGNSRLLSWEDFRAKRRVYRRSMAGYITARGWDPANLTTAQLEQARGHAYHDAQVATFQEENRAASAISRLEQTNSVTKVLIGGLVPYKSVPLNIAKQGMAYSPMGALTSGIKLHRALEDMKSEVRTGNKTAAEAIDGLAKGLTGSSILALGIILAAKGLLTAGGTDDDLDELETAQGGQEYALKIGDHSYTLDWAAPSALPLFMGAEAYNIGKELFDAKDGEEGEEAGDANAAERSLNLLNTVLSSATRFYDPMFNMTVLSGLSGAINSAAYGENQAAGVLVNALQNYGGQFVPTLLGQVNRTFFDDTRRTTFVDKNKDVDSSWQRFVQRQTNKIPGMSQKNMPYLDVWGRESRQENGFLRAFENFLSPGYLKKAEDSEVSDELKRLHEAGFEDVLPTKPKASATVAKEHLNKDQYEARAKAQGKTALDLLTEAMKGEAYQGMTDEEKAAYVASIFDYAKEKGKEAAGGDVTKKVAALEQAAKDHDIGVSALLQASMTIDSAGDADGNGSVNTEEAWNVIKNMDGPEALKRAAFDVFNGTQKDYDTYKAEAEEKARVQEEIDKHFSALPEEAQTAIMESCGGNLSSFTQDTAYSTIKSLGLSADQEEAAYNGINAVKGWTEKGQPRTWASLSAKQAKAQEKADAKDAELKKYFSEADLEEAKEVDAYIESNGGYFTSLTDWGKNMAAMGVPKSKWPTYYKYANARRGKKYWHDSYETAAKEHGW